MIWQWFPSSVPIPCSCSLVGRQTKPANVTVASASSPFGWSSGCLVFSGPANSRPVGAVTGLTLVDRHVGNADSGRDRS